MSHDWVSLLRLGSTANGTFLSPGESAQLAADIELTIASRDALKSAERDSERLDWALTLGSLYAWVKSKRHAGTELVGTVIRTREDLDAAKAIVDSDEGTP